MPLLIWLILGGGVAAAATYELFIKPKAQQPISVNIATIPTNTPSGAVAASGGPLFVASMFAAAQPTPPASPSPIMMARSFAPGISASLSQPNQIWYSANGFYNNLNSIPLDPGIAGPMLRQITQYQLQQLMATPTQAQLRITISNLSKTSSETAAKAIAAKLQKLMV